MRLATIFVAIFATLAVRGHSELHAAACLEHGSLQQRWQQLVGPADARDPTHQGAPVRDLQPAADATE